MLPGAPATDRRQRLTKATAWRSGSSGSMRLGGRRIGGYRADPRVATGFAPWRVSPIRIRGRPGHRSTEKIRSCAKRQETASETSGPGLPDQIAPQEALVNSASMVLLHDQGHEPDPREEPYVPPPRCAPHLDQSPKWRCHASRIQPPSAPHARATSCGRSTG